jgi:putative ABC transport system substrate-binding protein
MRRREFISALVGSAAWPHVAGAQQGKKVARIGFLTTGALDLPEARSGLKALYEGLREYGYIEGQNITLDIRAASSRIDRFPALASELVGLNPDVIIASNSVAARAVQQATTTIPIVVTVMGDPVGDGLVASLARPGGNITGLTFLGPQLVPKRLALLKEAIPKMSRIAVLWQPGAYGERTMNDMMREAEAAAQSLGLFLQLVEVQSPDDFDQAFSKIAGDHVEAVIVFPSSMLFTERRRIVEHAEKLRLPLMSMSKEFVQIGGLMSYGSDITNFNRLSAAYVDKILRGAKPADLPVEQPTKFELAINLKTAKLLGLSMPPTLLASADEVIE